MAEMVKMRAFAQLVDPYAGLVGPGTDNGPDFETTQEQANRYVKDQWAGPAGTDARDIELEVSQEMVAKRADAKKFATSSRQVLRNVFPNSAALGHDAAVDVQPQAYGTVATDQTRRTNQQVVTGTDGEEVVNAEVDPNRETGQGSGEGAQEKPYAERSNEALAKEAESRGLAKSGNKDELVARLEEDDAKNQ